MTRLEKLLLNSNASAFDALKVINSGADHIALIVNEEVNLIGIVTDGDIRRGLLMEQSLSSSVENFMKRDYHFIRDTDDRDIALNMMRTQRLDHIPVLNEENRVIDLILRSDLIDGSLVLNNAVVIMAGGKGSRLRPLTESCPKPMLKIGDKPMLEILIKQCISNGFNNFFLSVNYLKEQIIDYFEDGSNWGVSIEYLIEEKPLGTAGSLQFLPGKIKDPFLVINGDVLTKFNSSQLLSFHQEHKAMATICVREHEINVPFGVVKTNGLELSAFEEKPTYRQLVNAGVYVIDPILLSLLKPDQYIDMPSLLIEAQKNSNRVAVCPIHEYWIDVGRPESLEEANNFWESSSIG